MAKLVKNAELLAMQRLGDALDAVQDLPADARERVLVWARSRLATGPRLTVENLGHDGPTANGTMGA